MASGVMRFWIAQSVLLLALFSSAYAEDKRDFIAEFARLGIEELLAQPVSSVLRKEQSLRRAPSAVYVLKNDDIRRAGATSIQEALRLVPGLTVLRQNSSTWAVTARGFDSNGSAKLLVLIDGRSVYSPLFSGVFWDVQDVALEDIDRIEVIRGPGAVSWGENAVNGVINIITKSAQETQGGRIVVGGGQAENAIAQARYGDKLSNDTYYRVYVKHNSRDELQSPRMEGGADDEWNMTRGGFRLDSNLSDDSSFMARGEIYGGKSHTRADVIESFAPPFTVNRKYSTDLSGGNIVLRYNRAFSENSQLRLQAYYDRTERDSINFGERRDTFDFEAQHRYAASSTHDIVYGANYRVSYDDVGESLGVQFDDLHRSDHPITAFVQDEITLVPDRWSIIPGTKAGVNDYTGFEIQPALKTVFTPSSSDTWWASVSRAVRIPARIDDDIRLNVAPNIGADGLPNVFGVIGNRDFDAEKLIAYEIGYRAQPSDTFYFDVATFYHDYEDLLSFEAEPPFLESVPMPTHLVTPFRLDNNLEGASYGVELASMWRALEYLQLKATYSYINVDFAAEPGSLDTFSNVIERRTPHHQATFRIHVDLPGNIQVGSLFYYTDAIPSYNVKSSIRSDLRLAWQPSDSTAVELIGQNLFRAVHREHGNSSSQVGPAVFARFTWSFG